MTLRIARPSPSELDPELIEDAITGGSRAAFIRLYHHYEGKVRYSVARAALKSGRGRDVEELIQEVWCRLLKNDRRLLSYYDPDRGHFGPYISCVAYQQALYVLNLQRYKALANARENDEQMMLDERSTEFVAEMIQSDYFQKLLSTLDDELSAAERVLLREHYLGERSLRDLAEQLEITEDTIYQRNRRLKKKLARIGERLRPPPDQPTPSPSVMMGLLALLLTMPSSGLDEDQPRGDSTPEPTMRRVA